MKSAGLRLVLSLGRPDPDALSTAILWSLIAHVVLLTGAIVMQMIPSAPLVSGPAHFVSLAPPAPAGGGGGRPQPEPPRPQVTPPAPKEPAAEPPPRVTPAPTKASIPSQKPPKPAPPLHPQEAPPAEDGRDGTAGNDSGAGETGAPGAPGGVPGVAGGVGGTSFGEGDFRYAWYQTAIEAKLQSAWRRPIATEASPQTVTLSFTILRNGAVKDVAIATPSGNDALDLSAMRAVYDANPLPALPRGWSGDSLHVSMDFVLKPGQP